MRQSHRIENEQLQTAILTMTTSHPEGSVPVFIRCPALPQGRYLRLESDRPDFDTYRRYSAEIQQ